MDTERTQTDTHTKSALHLCQMALFFTCVPFIIEMGGSALLPCFAIDRDTQGYKNGLQLMATKTHKKCIELFCMSKRISIEFAIKFSLIHIFTYCFVVFFVFEHHISNTVFNSEQIVIGLSAYRICAHSL